MGEGLLHLICVLSDTATPEQVLSGSIPLHQISIPSFHGLRHRSPCRLFAVLVVHMLQHGLGRLRASASQPVIELIDAHGVRTLLAVEDHGTPIFGSPLDHVHCAEHTRRRFPPGVIVVTFWLPWFETCSQRPFVLHRPSVTMRRRAAEPVH